MGFWGKLFGIGAADIYPPGASSAELAPHEGPTLSGHSLTTMAKEMALSEAAQNEKVAANIHRFEMAIEQCSNPEKMRELNRNLAYWRAIASAREIFEGSQ